MICLMKKDFILLKKYMLFIIIIVFALPAAFATKLDGADMFQSTLAFAFEVIYSEFLICRYLSMKEYQYPKAAGFLCTLPYTRTMQVISKYLIYFIVFSICCLAYWIDTFFVPNLTKFDMEMAVPVLFISSILYSIYMPVQNQFGYDKSKLIFMLLLIVFPLFIANVNITAGMGILSKITYPVMLILALTALLLSAMASVRIFDGKEF
jgi:hypothetical protein